MKKQEEKHEKENFGSDGRDSDGTWNDDVSMSGGSKSRCKRKNICSNHNTGGSV